MLDGGLRDCDAPAISGHGRFRLFNINIIYNDFKDSCDRELLARNVILEILKSLSTESTFYRPLYSRRARLQPPSVCTVVYMAVLLANNDLLNISGGGDA